MLRSKVSVWALSFFLKNIRTFIARAFRLRTLLSIESQQRSPALPDCAFFVIIQSAPPLQDVLCQVFPNFFFDFIPPFIISFMVPAKIKEHGSVLLPLKELYKVAVAHEKAKYQTLSLYPKKSEQNNLNLPLFYPITLNDAAFPCLLVELLEFAKPAQFTWSLKFGFKTFRENYADLAVKFLSCYKTGDKGTAIKILSADRAILTFTPTVASSAVTDKQSQAVSNFPGISTTIPLIKKLDFYEFFHKQTEIELKRELPALVLDEFVRFSSIYADKLAAPASNPFLEVAFTSKTLFFNIDDFTHLLVFTDPAEIREFVAGKRYIIE